MHEATLRVRQIDGLPGMKQIVVDCEHGTTTGVLAKPTESEAAAEIDGIALRSVIATHHLQERCSCTASLRERLGITE